MCLAAETEQWLLVRECTTENTSFLDPVIRVVSALTKFILQDHPLRVH